MSVLALVTKPEDVKLVTGWAAEFAAARDTNLVVLCWAPAPIVLDPQSAGDEETDAVDELVAEVHRVPAPATEEKDGC